MAEPTRLFFGSLVREILASFRLMGGLSYERSGGGTNCKVPGKRYDVPSCL